MMHVLKFGGTSVGSVENIRRVGEILHIRSSGHKPLCVVVSAFAGVTNQLQKLTELAPRRSLEAEKLYEALRRRHEEVIRGLGLEKDTGLAETVHDHFTALWETVRGSYLLRECSVAVHDRMLGFGERLSAPIISAYLRSIGINSAPLDGTDIFISDDRFGGARINRKASLKRTEQAFRSGKDVYVVTGFVAASEEGAVTTLGRGGSDYTAAVLAAMLHAPEVEIWTDVSGIMTANPAVVRGARRLSSITYAEAMELSHFGAGVLYGPTIQPAMEQNIPIRILNTFKPLDAGTVINKSGGGDDYPVTGITAIDDVALLTMEGSGMAGVPGVAARLFGYLAAADINVILITQASSEHSICVAVAPSDMKKARRAIESGFRHEIKAHEIDPVKEQKGLSVLAVVGQNMRHKPGIAGKVFRALGRRRINVYAIAQGSSELNVSVVLEHDQLSEALNAVHDAFFDPGRVAVYCVGAGTVGGALLEMFKDAGDNAPRLAGLANSRRMLVDERGMAPGSAREALVKGRPLDMATFTASIPPGSVFVDCTASEDVAGLYETLLDKGVHVVAANKIALAESYDSYKTLISRAANRQVHFGFEATVGAGIPVIATLKMLRAAGDRIRRIEATLSGSLAYIFSEFTPEKRFADVVRAAMRLGYTEPDPRIDLSGVDVARKILILARLSGATVELSDIRQDAFLPESCAKTRTVDDFLLSLEAANDWFGDLAEKAARERKRLCYMAEFGGNFLSAGLRAIDATHPFATLGAGENMVRIFSDLYPEKPLTLAGMGAGARVTASAVFTDILRCAQQ